MIRECVTGTCTCNPPTSHHLSLFSGFSQGTAENVYIEDGHLVLRSQRQAMNGYEFTSGAVQTQGLHSWKG